MPSVARNTAKQFSSEPPFAMTPFPIFGIFLQRELFFSLIRHVPVASCPTARLAAFLMQLPSALWMTICLPVGPLKSITLGKSPFNSSALNRGKPFASISFRFGGAVGNSCAKLVLTGVNNAPASMAMNKRLISLSFLKNIQSLKTPFPTCNIDFRNSGGFVPCDRIVSMFDTQVPDRRRVEFPCGQH